MSTAIHESDDFAFGAEAADVGAIEDFTPPEAISWDADPAAILEAKELAYGANCYDQPIN